MTQTSATLGPTNAEDIANRERFLDRVRHAIKESCKDAGYVAAHQQWSIRTLSDAVMVKYRRGQPGLDLLCRVFAVDADYRAKSEDDLGERLLAEIGKAAAYLATVPLDNTFASVAVYSGDYGPGRWVVEYSGGRHTTAEALEAGKLDGAALAKVAEALHRKAALSLARAGGIGT